MNRSSLLLVLLLLGGWLSLGVVLRGEPLAVTPQEGILVLRSGGIVRGVITRAGSEYYVGVKAGEIRLNADEVELVCSDLDEAYRIKAAGLPTGHVSEHVELAQWCLQQNLLGYAARELLAGRKADPTFPKLELLERRLDLAMNPVEPLKASIPKKNTTADPEPHSETEEIVNRVPTRLIESFTSTIQPMLVNGCSNAACHGSTSKNKLHLERSAFGRPTSFRITQRNLASVLTCVDLENAAASPLLTLPLGAHGTAAEAVLTKRDLEKYRQLVAWVTDVTRTIAPPTPNNVSLPAGGPLLQTINGPRKAYGVRVANSTFATPIQVTEPPQFEQNSAVEQTPNGTQAETPSPFEPGTSNKTTRSALPTPAATMREAQEQNGHQFGAAEEAPPSADPFDPELFNRQFGGQ